MSRAEARNKQVCDMVADDYGILWIIALEQLKAAYSVTFDLLILELMFLFFKNTVKKLKFSIHFTNFVNLNKFSVSKQQHLS